MSQKFNRAQLSDAHTSKEYKALRLQELYPPYWDDGLMFYPKYRRGFKNPVKQITRIQQRSYRNWKHNRKTQYHETKTETLGHPLY